MRFEKPNLNKLERIWSTTNNRSFEWNRLVSFHLAFAQTSSFKAAEPDEGADEADHTEISDWFPRGVCLDFVDWQSDLPSHVSNDWGRTALVERFGVRFRQGMIQWMRGLTSEEDAVAFKMSFLEAAAALCSGKVNTQVSLLHLQRELHWVDAEVLPPSQVSSPTIAAVVKLVQNHFAALSSAFDVVIPLAGHLDLTDLGVMTPQRGIIILASSNTVKTIRSLLAAFNERRLELRATLHVRGSRLAL